ncbi:MULTISPECIES: PQQ-binding-like beta-propeller repeat protein [unclassified Streptomyces]|uniref:outer membrane protein assembly factor BamB family protein n=1 Tax=unclassified Streptomyces TaxID=2593676 RepID=UPI00081EB469|nr:MULTISPECIES: PQQ-binding-like beta-propeller repeat protein [unclassified Streptomyces]MYZ40052.1 PQQ-binding-like beta-propeller repeat protein [Streptomyces sp. SID4917]SCG06358.1 PQQ-like domain-containing protein [Streptomyces sp. MnatMP-M17]
MTQPPQQPQSPQQSPQPQPSQPSQQPPNEPPQGEFGAPQEPPAGGFGAPQEPPPGGYGYGAPTPPAQNVPYGYPHQQPQSPPGYGYPAPPGYGYPAQPGRPGQPSYGYPTQPMGPQGPYQQPPQAGGSGGSGGKKLSTQTQIIIAAAVAVVLIVGGGIWFASSGGDGKENESKGTSSGATEGATGGKDGKVGDEAIGGGGTEKVPANVRSKSGFQLPTPKVTDVTGVSGSWITDTAYVKTGVNEIVGFDLDKGNQIWSIPLPGQVCAATKHVTEDNKTAIAFEPAKRTAAEKYQKCTEVGAIDLEAGELLWTKSVTGSNAGDEKVRFDEITLSGTTVAAGGTDGGAAFDLTNGAVRWKPEVSADGCYDMGYGGGAGLVAARKCGSYDDPQISIDTLNPVTGAPLSSYKMPVGVAYASIVSTKPLVVAADVGDTAGDGSGISDFFSIDEKTGKLLAKIPADADRYAARCGSTEVESCQKLVVGNGRLYLPTEGHEGGGEYGDTNEIVSFDLTTGKGTSDRADAGDRYTMFPLRMDGGNIIAYKVPPYDKGGQIISIDGGTFKETVLMENPADKAVRDAETSFSADYAEILYGDGRMFLSETMLSKPSNSSLDDTSYLAVSFTTK